MARRAPPPGPFFVQSKRPPGGGPWVKKSRRESTAIRLLEVACKKESCSQKQNTTQSQRAQSTDRGCTGAGAGLAHTAIASLRNAKIARILLGNSDVVSHQIPAVDQETAERFAIRGVSDGRDASLFSIAWATLIIASTQGRRFVASKDKDMLGTGWFVLGLLFACLYTGAAFAEEIWQPSQGRQCNEVCTGTRKPVPLGAIAGMAESYVCAGKKGYLVRMRVDSGPALLSRPKDWDVLSTVAAPEL